MRTQWFGYEDDRPFWIGPMIFVIGGFLTFALIGYYWYSSAIYENLPHNLPFAPEHAVAKWDVDCPVVSLDVDGFPYMKRRSPPIEQLADTLRPLLGEHRRVRLRVRRDVDWKRVRPVLQAVKDSGARQFDITVRTRAGTVGVVALPLDKPLPTTAELATMQEFVNSVCASR